MSSSTSSSSDSVRDSAVTTDCFGALREFDAGDGVRGSLYSLPALEQAGLGRISRLPVSLRILLESVLRNIDGRRVTEAQVRQLASWEPRAERTAEIPFVVARIILQDFTGVPLLCDLAAMRGVARRMGKDPAVIEPLVPVDLVIDHSVQIDHHGAPDCLDRNMAIEFGRNRERYQFLKWGMQAFRTFRVIPPGIGIIHQVNLEHLARGLHHRDGIFFPDTVVGTDSHTTMINGIGVAGWGVGGIEAEACMLGQPLYVLTPDVIGMHLTGRLAEGVTATDLVLTVTELLRREKVVGAFVEYFGEGAASLSVPDRATLANMAPEYGATMGFFPVDDATVEFFRSTGKSEREAAAFGAYFRAQGMYGMPQPGELDYTRIVELDLGTVRPCVAGPRRPQDRIVLASLKERFTDLLTAAPTAGGFGRLQADIDRRFSIGRGSDIGHGDIGIAAITSCTNTSNPGVLLAAGLLAKRAVEKGLTVARQVKTSIAPGSRVVTAYLKKAGLLPYLERLGFCIAAYGCATCIGNAGPLGEEVEEAIGRNELVCAAVLSGNRNFEARINPSLRANFLMSPPLVVAFAIAGSVLHDMDKDPLGTDICGSPVYLRDIWPTNAEIAEAMHHACDPSLFRELYANMGGGSALWEDVPAMTGPAYEWPASLYIAEPPFFSDFRMSAEAPAAIKGARALGIFGDSITTDHISPAGTIREQSPAGAYLIHSGVLKEDFQSYGTRRGNHEVMVRGTFAHVRIRNLMLPAEADGTRPEGGYTLVQPEGERMPIFAAAMRYKAEGTPTVLFGGEEYGTGSSRDWAAKGTLLLGVRAVIARSFERIHRANLVGMGVLPLQFLPGDSVETLGISGNETFDLAWDDDIAPRQEITMIIRRPSGTADKVPLIARVETPAEAEYFRHGGILPFVLRTLLSASAPA